MYNFLSEKRQYISLPDKRRDKRLELFSCGRTQLREECESSLKLFRATEKRNKASYSN